MRKEIVTEKEVRINDNIILESGDEIHIVDIQEKNLLPETAMRKEEVTEKSIRINEKIILEAGDIIFIKEADAERDEEIPEEAVAEEPAE